MNNYAKLIDGRLEYASNSIWDQPEGLVCKSQADKLIPGYRGGGLVTSIRNRPTPPKHYRKTYIEEADRIWVGWKSSTTCAAGAAAWILEQPPRGRLTVPKRRPISLWPTRAILAEGKILEAESRRHSILPS